MSYEVFDSDVLVVGAGGAGCRSAIEASNYNVQVCLLTKDLLGKAHTVMAEGGINAALGNLDPEDNWMSHGQDTCRAGAYLNNQRLVEILVKSAPDMVFDLENFGAVFSRTPDGLIMQRPFGHQTYRRTCYAGDRTGHEVMSTLVEEIRRRDIAVYDEVFITSLLREGERVAGVTAIDVKSGDFRVYRGKATIIAAGGAGKIYEVTTNAQADVGSGYAWAYKAGAELIDMEHFQFHPTSMAFPEAMKGRLVTEGVRGEGGILLNKDGERFMKRYNPRLMELAGRDEVARAIVTEVREGRGTEHNGVYLDLSFIPSRMIEERLSTMLMDWLDVGVDIREEPMEVTPSAHHAMGGIRIGTGCETNLKGLFAAGEVAGGVHGGNRVGGNALAGINVFGAISGDSAAKLAQGNDLPSLSREEIEKERERVFAPMERGEGIKQVKIRRRLTKLMWDKVGIFRNEKDLQIALQEIKKMQREDVPKLYVEGKFTRYNIEWISTLEVSDMLLVSEMIARAALMRRESRGASYRVDYPTLDNKNWFKNIVIKVEGDEMKLTAVPVVVTLWKPPWMEGEKS